MSGQITINNGGEAPTAAKAGGGAATSTGSQADLMYQHGGPAPVATPTPGAPQAAASGDAGGTPSAGGFVRAR